MNQRTDGHPVPPHNLVRDGLPDPRQRGQELLADGRLPAEEFPLRVEGPPRLALLRPLRRGVRD